MMRIGKTLLKVLAVVVVASSNITGLSTPEVAELSPIEYFGGSDHDSYVQWYNETAATYTGCLYLEAVGAVEGEVSNSNGVAIHWRVDEAEEMLYLSFAARAQDGWIGFGMAEAGGMSGADLVIYETSKPNIITDAYVLRQPQPLIDDCQDWQFVSALNDGGFLIVEGMRKFDTKDTHDREVINDAEQFVVAQKIIAAWSNDSDTMTYHGKIDRARGALRWFATEDEVTSFQRQMKEEATGYFDLSFGNYSIKVNDTEYVSFCFNWDSDVVHQGLAAYGNVAMIALDIIADPATKDFLHHVNFFAKRNGYNASGVCRNNDIELEDFLYGWTFGSSPFRLPEDVGFVIGPGERDGFRGFRCEVHYNNPNMIAGMRDGSKLRIFYSTTLRKYELGVALMADFDVTLRQQPIDEGLSKYSFDCSDQCSLVVLDEPVTVLAEAFHMHNIGSAGVQYHIRNGEIIRKGIVDFFAFDQSGLHAIRQRPYQIYPGDSFSTSCIYDAKTPTVFGLKSVEEMCFFTFLYYPAKQILGQRQWGCGMDLPLSACNASFISDQFSLSDTQSLSPTELDTFYEREFGSQSSNQCSLKPPITFTASDKDKSSSLPVFPLGGKTNIMITLLSVTTLWLLHVVIG